MKKIFTLSKPSAFFIAFLCAISFGFGQVVAWEFNGNNGDEVTVNATTINANLNMSTLSRGSGINPTTLNDAFSSNDFTLNGTQANALTNNDYLQFQVSTQTGYQVSLSTLDVTIRRSNTGSNAYIWRYSTDGVNFNNIGTPISYTVNAGNGTAQAQINLSAIAALQNVQFGTTITFRLYAWGATNVGGTFAIGRLAGNDLSIGGVVSVAPPCPTTTTWNGATWSAGVPTITTNAIINGNYNTTANGNITACSLTVNAGFTLNVTNNSFVQINNNVTNSGNVTVQTSGSFVQNANTGTFTLNGAGTSSVIKQTAVKQNWYYYTYWSSPVVNETVDGAFPDTDTDRRFEFNASNYLDLDGNDIDDNANDWQLVSGASLLVPGKGYAATSSPFGLYPGTDIATFDGALNTGNITTPIVYNAANLNSWNFIGNPYPSALDFNAFYSANSSLVDGVAYFWSQSLPPQNSNPGNEVQNFNQNDYATWTTGSGGAAGASGFTPTQYVPSGQGFFVVGNANGNATFTNAMRSTGNNTQFFRSSNTSQANKPVSYTHLTLPTSDLV